MRQFRGANPYQRVDLKRRPRIIAERCNKVELPILPRNLTRTCAVRMPPFETGIPRISARFPVLEPAGGHPMPYHSNEMHPIGPATLKPGVRITDLARDESSPFAAGPAARSIRGKALILWDPKLPGTKYGRKLDASDTDPITPPADCASESLATL